MSVFDDHQPVRPGETLDETRERVLASETGVPYLPPRPRMPAA
jgi:hypothetical protein